MAFFILLFLHLFIFINVVQLCNMSASHFLWCLPYLEGLCITQSAVITHLINFYIAIILQKKMSLYLMGCISFRRLLSCKSRMHTPTHTYIKPASIESIFSNEILAISL